MSGRTGLQAAWRCSKPALASLAFAAFAVWLSGSCREQYINSLSKFLSIIGTYGGTWTLG